MELDIFADGISACSFWFEMLCTIFGGYRGRIMLITLKIIQFIADVISCYVIATTPGVGSVGFYYTIIFVIERATMLFLVSFGAFQHIPSRWYEYMARIEIDEANQCGTNNTNDQVSSTQKEEKDQTAGNDAAEETPKEAPAQEARSESVSDAKEDESDTTSMQYTFQTLYYGQLFNFSDYYIKMNDYAAWQQSETFVIHTAISETTNARLPQWCLNLVFGAFWLEAIWEFFVLVILVLSADENGFQSGFEKFVVVFTILTIMVCYAQKWLSLAVTAVKYDQNGMGMCGCCIYTFQVVLIEGIFVLGLVTL